jgi:hypothetical protein
MLAPKNARSMSRKGRPTRITLRRRQPKCARATRQNSTVVISIVVVTATP